MFRLYFISFFTFFSFYLFSDDGIFGYWLTSGSIVKIEDCNSQICGRIVTVFVEDGINPKSILDENNKNKSLRERTLSLENEDLRAHLRTTVVNQIAIDQPNYSGLKTAINARSA